MSYELTVAEAMHFPSLSKAEVVSGFRGINNVISTVIVGDTLDIADWISETDFVLSAVPFMRKGSIPAPSEEILYKWALSICKRRPSAIGIKTMRLAEDITEPRKKNSWIIRGNCYLDHIPESIRALGDEYNVPIIEFPAFASQNAVNRDVMWGILRKYEQTYKNSMNAFLDMCNIILDEHDIPALAERLADYMGNPILIEDQSFKLIATSELNKAVHPEHIELFSVRRSEPVLTELRLKLMEEPGNLLRHTLTVKGKKVEQEIMPIMVGSNIIGYVSVLGADQPVSEENRDLFIICASAIAIDMHPKTIKYRIEQILKLLPLDLSDMNDRSVVWIALKLLPQRGHQARNQVGGHPREFHLPHGKLQGPQEVLQAR